MTDPRLAKLADVLVNYSTAREAGRSRPPVGPGGRQAAAGRALSGRDPRRRQPVRPVTSRRVPGDQALEGSDEQLTFANPVEMFAIEKIDVSISLWGEDNTKALTQVDAARQGLAGQARKPMMQKFFERAAAGELRWCGTQFPCHAAAQDAEMSLAEYEDFVFAAGLLHLTDPAAAWRTRERAAAAARRLSERKTEIPLRHAARDRPAAGVAGRRWINCDGHENFPDGEVFTGPIEDAVEGYVCYSFPAVHGGREVDGIRLHVPRRPGRRGLGHQGRRLPHRHARSGRRGPRARRDRDRHELLHRALHEEHAVRRENRRHVPRRGRRVVSRDGRQERDRPALGHGLRSARGGQIFVDGKLISENGRFLDPTWPAPEAAT